MALLNYTEQRSSQSYISFPPLPRWVVVFRDYLQSRSVLWQFCVQRGVFWWEVVFVIGFRKSLFMQLYISHDWGSYNIIPLKSPRIKQSESIIRVIIL